ncbi:energy-coupling factor ABC transporter substrate-binding protein [Alkaliphilus sp. B6464]|uniref:energy-coupling factor ABC transporter substrate-binding protein n=1 Tax=Alkaliphilus sp. B6464 TaxID=2731219 RepID=UPI001BA9DDEB|nr:energy-coupling factor ABC transporter substrate-binding protein [Alkaliphilus sp. B6464]QUH19136.1 energy-coupling factor ABC transporter substrate-binding protein [Alkaliphilus sp. B6464]
MKQLSKKNLLLFLLAIVVIVAPLIINSSADFEGADGEGEELIQVIAPDYEPWFESIWEPPSGEVESLLFSVQVAIGAGAIGYILGSMKEKKKLALNR